MSTMSLKEKAILAALGTVLAYALVIALWVFNLDRKMGWCPKSWADAMRKYQRESATYRAECRLISEKAKWREAYEEEKSAMPMFEGGRATDTTWLSKMDEIAKRHNVVISQRQAGKETEAGDVLELEIDVRNWEGALESLVKFIHELENTEEGMFDIKTINFKPSSKRGYLKGSFSLTCAYMRE